jgi:hypothetical protein
MEHSSELFTDEAIAQLADTSLREELDQMDTEHVGDLARNKMWKAIKKHNFPITVCRNPKNDEKALSRLIDYVLHNDTLLNDDFASFDERYNAAIEIAEGVWNDEIEILGRLISSIENQIIAQPLDPAAPVVDISHFKRQLMAAFIAENQPQLYVDLANAALDGRPLLPADDDYFDMCAAALFDLENNEAPHRQLYYQLRTILGVPLDGLLPGGPYSEAQGMQFLTLNGAAERIVAITRYYSDEHNQGTRHRDILEILAVFAITDPALHRAIFDITDAYLESPGI